MKSTNSSDNTGVSASFFLYIDIKITHQIQLYIVFRCLSQKKNTFENYQPNVQSSNVFPDVFFTYQCFYSKRLRHFNEDYPLKVLRNFN